MKLQKKLLLAFLLISLVPLAGTSIFSYLNTRKTLTQKVLDQLNSVSKIERHRIESITDQNLEKLTLVSSRTQLRRNLESFIKAPKPGSPSQRVLQDKMNQILLDVKSSSSKFKSISILTLDEKIVASTNTSIIGAKHSSTFFTEGKKGNDVDIFFLIGIKIYECIFPAHFI